MTPTVQALHEDASHGTARHRGRIYCRKPTYIRGASAPAPVRFAATMILPSALTPPVCTLPLTWVSVSTPVEVTGPQAPAQARRRASNPPRFMAECSQSGQFPLNEFLINCE
jgi:hypothetical protein